MKKTIALLLLISMLLAAVACGESAEQKEPGQSDTQTGDETQTETEISFPEENYEGYEFRLFGGGRSSDTDWKNEFYTETATGEPIADAVYSRNMMIMEKYNVTVAHVVANSFVSDINKSVNAGDDSFDLCFSDLFDMTNVTQTGDFLDINSLSGVDLDNSWWDASSVRDLSIGHRVYFAAGDINFRSYIGSWIYLFSKTVIENYNLSNPYDFVNAGTWTVDKFIEMTKGIAGDVDGDGKMTDADRYGLITEAYNTLGMFFGAGCVTIAKDENDYPIIAVNTTRGEEVVTKVLALMNDTDVTANVQQSFYGYDWAKLDAVFSDERGLFYSIVLSTVMRIRSADVDFGIIPMPKYDDAQEQYCTWVSPFIAHAVGVPITSKDTERTAVLMEYMGYTSQLLIKPAVYDITLQRKLVRDDESSGMLDLIFSNRIYDLGTIYDWGGVGTFIPNLSFTKNSFSTKYAALETNAQTALDATIEGYEELK